MMAGSLSPPGLQSLAAETLEEVYIQSENLSLPLVCRRFHLLLSKSIVRLHFCTHMLYRGNPTRINSTDISRMSDLQTDVFAQKWFTLDFSSELETAVLKLQEPAYQKRVAEAELHNRTHSDSWQSPGKNKVICTFAKLPRHALSGPWTDDRVNFLLRLMRWNAKRGMYDIDIADKGMRDAIIEGRPEIVKLLSESVIGVELDQELLRLAVIDGGCNKAIVKLFAYAALEDETSIDWRDKKLRQWARKKTNKGDEKGAWLLDLMDSNGDNVSEDEYEFYF